MITFSILIHTIKISYKEIKSNHLKYSIYLPEVHDAFLKKEKQKRFIFRESLFYIELMTRHFVPIF